MIWLWLIFLGFVLAMLALDLGVFHRKAHAVSMKEAIGWSVVWITLGLAFSVFVYFGYERQWFGLGRSVDSADGVMNSGSAAVVKYLTGYVVEKSLSIDNVFVIAMIFGFFAVPPMYQHRVLFWGILGALVMRGLMIGVGAVLIAKFHWILYVFGAFLIVTAIKMLLMKSDHGDPGQNMIVRLTRRLFPVTDRFHGERFVVRADTNSLQEDASGKNGAAVGKWMLTPLAMALIMVETTDLIFAVDSIPAIFAITADPFLAFTSNVFAMLGLRSLYFALASLMDKFRYLKVSLALVLAIVGAKMLSAEWLKAQLGKNFNFYLLAVILCVLAGGMLVSWWVDRRRAARPALSL